MLLKKLEIEGIGPFIKKAEINFEDLSFFCIQGDNGSGKSTLIDAVFIALWGKTPKASLKDLKPAKSPRLRVFLSFEIDGKIIDVERIRGRGANDYLEVKKTDGSKESVQGAKEVSFYIENQLHLKQRVVQKAFLIRQGEFAQILESGKKEEREAILQMMLGDLFEKISEKITLYEQEYEEKTSSFRKIWGSFSLKENNEAIHALKEAEEKFKQTVKNIEDKKLELESCYKKLIEQQTNYQNYTKLLENLNQHRKEEKKKEQRQSELLKIQKALSLVEELNTYLQMQKRQEDLQKERKEVEESYWATKKGLEKENKELQKLRLLKEKATENYEKFYDLLQELAFERKRLEKDYLDNKQILKPKEKESLEYKEIFFNEEKKLKELDSEQKELSKSFEDEEKIEKNCQFFEMNGKRFYEYQILIKNEKEILNEVQTLEKDLADLKEKIEISEISVKELSLKLEEEKKLWTQNQAALIQKELTENDTCPVCGGVFLKKAVAEKEGKKEHKDFYLKILNNLEKNKLEISVFSQQKKEKDQILKKYKERLNSILKQKESERTFFKTMGLDFNSDYDAIYSNVKKEKSKIEENRQSLKILSQKQSYLKSLLKEKVAQSQKLEKEIETFKLKEKALLQQGEKLKSDIEEIYKKIGFEKAKSQDVELYLKKIKENKELTLKKYSNQEQIVLTFSSKLEKQEEKRKVLIKQEQLMQNDFKQIEQGFLKKLSKAELDKKDVEQARFYTGKDVEQEKAEIVLFFEKLNQLSLQVKEAEAEKLKDYSNEIEENQRQKEALNKELMNLFSDLKLAEKEKESLGKLRDDFLQKEAEQKNNLNIQKSYKELKKDFQSSKFPAFFARLVLKRVISKANKEFLSKILGGRYLLMLDENNDKLLVEDQNFKQERATETLSGGEKFLVSFALALSFSKMIGERIGMFFIDEGFGSLDQNNRVLLGEIFEFLNAEKSRKIGIITHVKEIADTITQKIFVIKEEEGSKLEIQV